MNCYRYGAVFDWERADDVPPHSDENKGEGNQNR